MSFHQKTTDAAKGKWRGILMQLGVPEENLTGRHAPCPLCGGKDRFRWDNQEGKGTYICSNCGAGDGMKLAMEFTGEDFQPVAKRIDAIVGNVKADAIPEQISDDERKKALLAVWGVTQQTEPGDVVDAYLRTRGVDEVQYPKALRTAEKLRDGEGGVHPAMVALVTVPGQPKAVSLHRTFLAKDGKGKADIPSPRKMMPGSLPDGACIELSEYTGGPLGIAEGIETAMAASAMYQMPVWSAINTSILKKWLPPDGCDEVWVFGDNDASFAGHAASYELARRLHAKNIQVDVRMPPVVGEDWNDLWLREKA